MANQKIYSGRPGSKTADTAVLELVRLLAKQAAQEFWAQQNATGSIDNPSGEDSTEHHSDKIL